MCHVTELQPRHVVQHLEFLLTKNRAALAIWILHRLMKMIISALKKKRITEFLGTAVSIARASVDQQYIIVHLLSSVTYLEIHVLK